MNIAIINGSPRKNGATGKLLIKAKEILTRELDVAVDYYNLSDYEMKLCKGCISCYKTGECVIKNDGIEELTKRIKESDGIIIGSPTFGSNVTPHLKNFFDRSHFLLEQGLADKPCVSLVTYEIADGQSTQKILSKFLIIAGGSVKSKMLFKVEYNGDPLRNTSISDKLEKGLQKLVRSIRTNRGKSVLEWLLVNFVVVQLIWKPVFIRNREKYAGILNAWKRNTRGSS